MRNTTKLFIRSLFTLVFLHLFLSMAWAVGPQFAVPDTVYTEEDISIDIPVLDNDSIPNGGLDTASLVVPISPANGTVVVDTTTGLITYTPDSGFIGTDTFLYKICDKSNPPQCDSAVITVIVGETGGCYGVIVPFLDQRRPGKSTEPFNVSHGEIDYKVKITQTPVFGFVKIRDKEGNPFDPASIFIYYCSDMEHEEFHEDRYQYEVTWGERQKKTLTPKLMLCRYECEGSGKCKKGEFAYYFSSTGSTDLFISSDCITHDDVLKSLSGPTKGKLTSSEHTGHMTYTPDPNEKGNDSFSYTHNEKQIIVRLFRLDKDKSPSLTSRPMFPVFLLIGGLLLAVLIFLFRKKRKK